MPAFLVFLVILAGCDGRPSYEELYEALENERQNRSNWDSERIKFAKREHELRMRLQEEKNRHANSTPDKLWMDSRIEALDDAFDFGEIETLEGSDDLNLHNSRAVETRDGIFRVRENSYLPLQLPYRDMFWSKASGLRLLEQVAVKSGLVEIQSQLWNTKDQLRQAASEAAIKINSDLGLLLGNQTSVEESNCEVAGTLELGGMDLRRIIDVTSNANLSLLGLAEFGGKVAIWPTDLYFQSDLCVLEDLSPISNDGFSPISVWFIHWSGSSKLGFDGFLERLDDQYSKSSDDTKSKLGKNFASVIAKLASKINLLSASVAVTGAFSVFTPNSKKLTSNQEDEAFDLVVGDVICPAYVAANRKYKDGTRRTKQPVKPKLPQLCESYKLTD